MHQGTEYVRNYILQTFVILGLRETLKQDRHRCFFCRRFQWKRLRIFMWDLPPTRFQDPIKNPCRFKNFGIDYIGPFHIAETSSTTKQYICLFTCFTTRARHLETTESLTTDSCGTAIRRFIARRGSPKYLLLDNASYFMGTRKQLRSEPLSFDREIASYLKDQNISWKMNPPSAPHFVGVWERLVQMTKRVFLLNLGSARLSRDLFITIASETAGILNGRPLTHVISDVADNLPLTPNHFLFGRSLSTHHRWPSATNQQLSCPQNPGSWWKRRWIVLAPIPEKYAPTLIRRTKWSQPEDIMKTGDLVWMMEDFTPLASGHLDGLSRFSPGLIVIGKITRPAVKLSLVTPKKNTKGSPEDVIDLNIS